MNARKKNGPPGGPPEDGKEERLTLEEFKRLVEEAKKRGEPIDPLVERLVVSTIDEVRERLEEEDEPEPSD